MKRLRLPEQIGGLQIVIWIRQISIFLFAISALVLTVTSYQQWQEDDREDARRETEERCLAEAANNLSITQNARVEISNSINTTGWSALLASVTGATDEELQDDILRMQKLIVMLDQAEVEVQGALENRQEAAQACRED